MYNLSGFSLLVIGWLAGIVTALAILATCVGCAWFFTRHWGEDESDGE